MKAFLFYIAVTFSFLQLNAQNLLTKVECEFDGIIANCEFPFTLINSDK